MTHNTGHLQSTTTQADSLQILRLVQAATQAGWGQQRTTDSIARFCQTGVFPQELLRTDKPRGPRASTAIGAPQGGQTNGRNQPRGPRPILATGQGQNLQSAPVTGANACPLGPTARVPPPIQQGVVFTAQDPQSSQVPRVPMPGTQQVTGQAMQPQIQPQGPPQVQAQATWMLPPPVMPQLPPGTGWLGQPQAMPQPAPPQNLHPTTYTQPFATNLPQSAFRPVAPPVQPGLQPVPPRNPPPAGGIFGNHSFGHGAVGQPAEPQADLRHWTYDPYGYREKPLMKINNVIFDGTSRSCSFEEFKATFEVVCGGRNIPEAQKLVCLKQSLQGDPLKIFNNVVGLDLLPGSLERVIRTLESHYGGHQRIVNSYINRLMQYPVVRRFDCTTLLDLLTLVEEIYNRYETHDPGYLERDQMMVSHIRRIIPSDERAQYYTKLAEHQRRDTFLTLRDFLRARYESLRLAAISDVGTVKHVTNIQDDRDQDTDFSVIERQRAEDDEVLLASSEAKGPFARDKCSRPELGQLSA